MKVKARGLKARKADEAGRGDASRSRLRLFAFALLLFALAFCVRLLLWQETRLEVGRVQTAVTENYRHMARLLSETGLSGFFSPSSPASDPDTLGHPPGYPLLLALAGRVIGESEARVQLMQAAADSLAAVVTLLLAAELLPRGAAYVAGLLAALAPQFAWNSLLLLPDTLAVLPLLLAVYTLALALRRPRLALFLMAGALAGLSCWLRANALLLAPFLAASVFLLFGKGERGRYALMVLAGALLVVAPLTLRNALVFGSFIPVSLGAGQTLLEGIADYDAEGRFGIPATDLGIMRQEAEREGRPDYAQTLFGPDAIRRDRARVRRALEVVGRNPFWFLSVMARRAASMLRLERARTLSPRPQVTHALEVPEGSQPLWSASGAELATHGRLLAPRAESSHISDALRVKGDESKDGPQFAAPPVTVEAGTDYLFEVTAAAESGRMALVVADAEDGARSLHASTLLEKGESLSPEAPAFKRILLPFVSTSGGAVRLLLLNAPSEPPRPSVLVAGAGLYRLGAASLAWTRYPRALLAAAQRLFITAVMLPLALAGFALAIKERRRGALVLLSVVPVYYFCVQSALHTEYRYVLALHHLLFAFASLAVWRACGLLLGVARKLASRGA